MTALNLTSADAALKQLYKAQNFQESTYKRRPILGILPKAEDFFGRNMPLVNEYGNPQGVSAAFATAQSVTTAAKLEDFLLTRVNEHSVATIDGETLDAMSNNVGAFVTAMKVQVDGAMNSLANRLESLAPLSGTGSLGRLATTAASGYEVSTTTIKLNDINTVHRFEVGMTVSGASTDGGALDTGGATGEVIAAIDRIDGVLTSTSAAWSTVLTAIADGDYIGAIGDMQAAGTAKVTSGLEAWVPASAPGTTAFFGVDRSADVTRLGGTRHTATGLVKTAIIDGASICSALEGEPDHAILHHVKYRQLCKELDSQTQYRKVPARGQGGREFARVSYTGAHVITDTGEVVCLASNKVASGTIFLLEIATWIYASIGALTKFNMPDGLRILRQASSDGVEARLVSRGNIGCKKPGANCNISHS